MMFAATMTNTRCLDPCKPLVFLICFCLLGCGDSNSSDGSGDPDEIIALECEGFFDSGDYSSMCFVDGATPTYTADPPVASGCIYRVGDRPDSTDDEISVLMIENAISVANATSVFAGLKQDAEEEMEGTITDISGVGDEAYVVDVEEDTGSFAYLEKSLNVRYRNLIFAFGTIYDVQNQPSCSHENAELEKFARLVIENIDAQL